MLQLRPNCEHCDTDLPADSTEARICSFECTFCADCVRDILRDVCPNCGGNLVPRPIRPAVAHRAGVSLATRPASTDRVHKPLDPAAHAEFAATVLATRRA